MNSFKSKFLKTLDERGFIHQTTNATGLDSLLCKETVSAYMGFDLTAPSLHIGSLVGIMMMRHLQDTGHRPIVLLGGGTSLIGDPSGKNSTRPILDTDTINSNKDSIRKIFEKFLIFDDSDNSAVIADNIEWLGGLGYINFIRDVGSKISVNSMVKMDTIKSRLDKDEHLSFLELNYNVVQAYDFIELNRRHDVKLQLGGSDQYGNLVQGINLGHKILDTELFGLTCPLLTNSSGEKMGKTADGAVWLNPEMISANDFWQFWRNIPDADVGRFLKLFTLLPMNEIKRLSELQGQEINEAKIVLANEVTAMIHGDEKTEQVAQSAAETFSSSHGIGDELPRYFFDMDFLVAGSIGLLDIFVETGLCQSKSEVRRMMRENGIKVNDTPITDESYRLSESDLNDNKIKLSRGKKKHVILESTNR